MELTRLTSKTHALFVQALGDLWSGPVPTKHEDIIPALLAATSPAGSSISGVGGGCPAGLSSAIEGRPGWGAPVTSRALWGASARAPSSPPACAQLFVFPSAAADGGAAAGARGLVVTVAAAVYAAAW